MAGAASTYPRIEMPRHNPMRAGLRLGAPGLEDELEVASSLLVEQLHSIFGTTDKMAPRKGAQSTTAEVSLVHLKNCLVNLPSSLVSLLLNVNTVSFSDRPSEIIATDTQVQ